MLTLRLFFHLLFISLGGGQGGVDNPVFWVEDSKDKNITEVEVNKINGKKKRIYGHGEQRRIMRNVLITSGAFTLLFTAFQSMGSLMSSFYPSGLGNDANTTIYVALVFSCMFLPTFLISKFTVKWTLVFSVFGYSLYMAAQFEPIYGTLIPAAVIVGLCAAPLWSAKCTYLTHIGHEYGDLVGEVSEVIIVRFFGIFFLAFQSSQIWGNLISSLVLGTEDSEGDKDISVCGSNFCPSDAKSGNIREVSDASRYTIAGIYFGSSIAAAILLALFLDPLIRYGEKDRDGESSQLTGVRLFLATSKQMIKPYQILLIPITIWSGMEQGFLSADFTQGYISCAWDVGKVGYVLICYGVCDSLCSISFGPIVKRFGRVPIFLFGALINGGTIILLFLWKPNPDTPILFFIVAGLWGVGDAIWQTQINALYGVIFSHNEEPAFSNYRLWESIGFIIAFVSGNNLCIDTKLINLSIVLFLGMLGYLTVEFLIRKKRKNSADISK